MTSGKGTAVTMLLLGEPAFDYRVIKEASTLTAAGYRVTIVCLPPGGALEGPVQIGGAAIIRCTAPRPLRFLTRLLPGRSRSKRETVGEKSGIRTARATGSASVPLVPVASINGDERDARAPRRFLTWTRSQFANGIKQRDSFSSGARRDADPHAKRIRWRVLRETRALAGTLWLNLALARAAIRVPAGIVHAHDLDTLWAGTIIARKLGARLIYDAHELYPDMLAHSSQLYNGCWRLIEHRLIARTRAVITVNQVLAGELRNRHRLPRLPAVVMNCPPLQPVPPRSQGNNATIGIIYLGALLLERGLEGLLRALPTLDPRVVLHIRGSGPLRPWLDAQLGNRDLKGRLIVHEPVPAEQLGATLAGMDIGVIPYVATSLNNYLCSPNKLFDYCMGGLAVVASDLPEIRRELDRHGAGLLYNQEDPAALAEAIHRLIADPALLRRLQQSARRAAEEEFHWANQARVLLEVYGE